MPRFKKKKRRKRKKKTSDTTGDETSVKTDDETPDKTEDEKKCHSLMQQVEDLLQERNILQFRVTDTLMVVLFDGRPQKSQPVRAQVNLLGEFLDEVQLRDSLSPQQK